MKNILIAVCAIAACLSVAAADDAADESAKTIAVAEQYLAAYSTFDPAKIEPFLAEDMVFHDPTSTDQTASGGPFHFEGKEATLKELGAYAAQYQSFTVGYDIERQYESNGNVIFVAQLTYSLLTPDNQNFTGTAPMVTVIKIENGKVARHTDYYDYKGNAVDLK